MRKTYESSAIGAEWLADQLEKSHPSGDGFMACCPAHNDEKPSLSISDGDDGKVLLYCHAGCEQDEVIEALRELELWPPHGQISVAHVKEPRNWAALPYAPHRMPSPQRQWFSDNHEIDDIYVYRRCDGKIAGYVYRMVDEDGEKSFRPIAPCRGPAGRIEWRAQAMARPTPLFGAHELVRRTHAPVLVVEGEKTAIAAKDIFPDYVVVTWAGGANAVSLSDWSPLAGRDVTIWPDADNSGKKAAKEIFKMLERCNTGRNRIVDLPKTLPDGWDLADSIPKGIDIHEILRSKFTASKNLIDFVLSAEALGKTEIAPRSLIIDPFLPEQGIALIYAARGVGKTWLAMTLGIAIAKGEDFLGFHTPESRRVLYIDGEMTLADLKKRLDLAGASSLENFEILPSELLFRDEMPLNIASAEEQARIEGLLKSLADKERRPDVLIFDNLSALRAGVDENDNAVLDGLLRWFLSLRHRSYSIIVVHHAGKSGDQRGGSRLEDFLDTTIKLERTDVTSTAARFDLIFTKLRGEPIDPNRITLELISDKTGKVSWECSESVRKAAFDDTLRAVYGGPNKNRSSRFKSQIEIARALNLQKPAVSKHFKQLKENDWVQLSSNGIAVTRAGLERLRNVFHDEEFLN